MCAKNPAISFPRFLSSMLLPGLYLTSIGAVQADLLARDLDQNAGTIEAYYDPQLDLSILVDGNLASTESFGIPAAEEPSFSNDYSPGGIYPDGRMSELTMALWLDSMNASGYLGYSNWRLPGVDYEFDPVQFNVFTNNELQQLLSQSDGTFFNSIDTDYLMDSLAPNGIEYSYYPESDSYRSIPPRAPGAIFGVWPVHSGDIGMPICIDPDGDGWGWDGSMSCQIVMDDNCSYTQAHLYDGWGWNSVTRQSCPPKEENAETDCVDSDGDGWGWDGFESCRVEATIGSSYLITTGEVIESGPTLRWNESDLADKKLLCDRYTYVNVAEAPNQYVVRGMAYEIQSSTDVRVHDLGVVTRGPNSYTGYFYDRTWSINPDGSVEGLPLNLPAIETPDGYRFVNELDSPDANGNLPITHYTECRLENGVLRASGTGAACIDSDGDGWGWDGSQSCRVGG